jgi:hypothetical protein
MLQRELFYKQEQNDLRLKEKQGLFFGQNKPRQNFTNKILPQVFIRRTADPRQVEQY